MEGSFGYNPASTPRTSNAKVMGNGDHEDSVGFDIDGADDDDDSNAGVYTAETRERQIPVKMLSDIVRQPSIFQMRNQTKSSRLVRFNSDNSHIFDQIFDYSDSSSADGNLDGDFTPEQSYHIPIEGTVATSRTTSLIQRALVGIAKAAYRSPPSSPLQTRTGNHDRDGNESDEDDGSTFEFQHSLSYTNLALMMQEKTDGQPLAAESQPLLRHENAPDNESMPVHDDSESSCTREQHEREASIEEKRSARIAAAFLNDYENCRPCSLPEQVNFIRESQLRCHWLRFHPCWKAALYLAAISLFIASSFEGADETSIYSNTVACVLTFVPMGVFAIDILIRRHYRMVILPDGSRMRRSESTMSLSAQGSLRSVDIESVVHTRKSRSRQWQFPLLLLFVTLSLEMTVASSRTIWSSALKPIVFFYISSNARDALEALRRVAPTVTKVICMELFIILSFAAVATHTYIEYPEFNDLATSFLSLFKLATTVVNPSIWIEIYSTHRSAALFFIFFIVTSVFYLHSLVLSVVFQTYIQAVREIRERSFSDREDALRLAFMTLEKKLDMTEEQSFPAVRTSTVGTALTIVRPHYAQKKINTLLHVLDPDGLGLVDYDTFRSKIPKALSTSLRTNRRSTFVGGLLFELFAAGFAVANLVYVLILSSSHEPNWWKLAEFPVGFALTVVGLFEVLIRLCPARLPFSVPTRFNRIFDGLALLAAAVSGYGILLRLTQEQTRHHIEFLLAGRAMDMMRIMRMFGIFRSFVKRSGEVIPAISGPFILVLSVIHILTYLGIALWRDAVEVGACTQCTPFYDLNNFNSYTSGLVTMFQVLVVNDWHAIAEVYLYAKRCSDPAIVYSFFIGANLMSVSILLNVLTAFFVGAFVARMDGSTSEEQKQISTHEGSSPTDTSDFNVVERQGFDKIMETVAGDSGDDSGWVRKTCEILEIFESLTPEAERVGHLVCCSQSEERYGNRRFLILTKDFFGEDMLHMIVSDMHSELINSLAATKSMKESSVMRTFEGASRQLELSASLVSSKPPVSLFVARETAIGNGSS